MSVRERLSGLGTGRPDQPDSPLPVPPLLRDTAGWAWRLLILALAAYLLVRLLDLLYLLVLPLLGALFVAALLRPIVAFFRRHGFPRALATWLTIILGFAVLGGVVFFVVERVSAESGALTTQLSNLITHGRNILVHDFHVSPHTIDATKAKLISELNAHRSALVSGVFTGVTVVAEVVTGAVLAFFISFFLLYDGDRIWAWLVQRFPARARGRIEGAGSEAWGRIGGWVRGTFLIAVFHAVVVGVTLIGLGAPLVAPLSLLVFLGSFIPIVGAVIFGGFAALVTLVDLGPVPALILVGVLLIDNQIEAHLLQPFLVGRYVRLHPLAVVLVIAGGGFLQGIEGAMVALPLTSAAFAAAQSFARSSSERTLAVPEP